MRPQPMLARLTRELPVGDYLYEPKWDGLRCLAFCDDDITVASRHDKPFERYFPEVVDALRTLGRRCILDGELVVVGTQGFDFGALLKRVPPAKPRVENLRHETPASFIVFDLLALDGEDLMQHPFATRRARLETLLA